MRGQSRNDADDPPMRLGGGSAGRGPDARLLDRFRTGGGEVAEAAFAALIQDHGPMVRRVCRTILRDPQDVQDAFQVTFLVLFRRAESIEKGDAIGPWLHGVARRVALRAKADASRRLAFERRAAERASATAGDLGGGLGLVEEVGGLPEKYRLPVVLCYFEGMTHDEAGRRLGWPVGTVRSRLAKARELLRAGLTGEGEASAVRRGEAKAARSPAA